MEIYLKNIFNEKLEIINENKANKVDYDFIKFLGKSNSNIINKKKKKNNNYDCIFFEIAHLNKIKLYVKK